MAKQLNVDMRFTADTGKAKQAVNDLEQSLQRLGHGAMPQNAGINPAEFEKASAAARELEFHLKNAYNAKTGNLDLSKLASSLNASKTNLRDLTSGFANAGTVGQQAFINLARAIATADQPSLTLNTHLSTMWTTLKNVARFQISSSIMHGLIGGIQTAYGYAQDLNESLNNIRIVTGQSTSQMARFAEQANKGAKALSSTTLDYTNASLIYYQQGLDDDAVRERTEVTLKMANVAHESAETVSEQMTAIWNNFDDGSKSLEYYADVITALGAATASSSSEISAGLNKFAAVADTVGLSYENATAALATITAITRQSADTVGTGLKTLFSRLQGLSLGETLEDGVNLNKYSEALAKVGVQALDSSGNLRRMDDVLEDLGKRWGDLTKAQQTALAQTVGGVRQYTTLVALMDNWDFMKQNQEVAANAGGTLQEQADIYTESWEAARDRVRTAAEGIYKALLDEDFFIQIDKTIEHILTGVKGFIDSFGGIQSILTGVLSFVLQMVSSKIGPAVQKLVQNFAVLTGGANQVYQKIQSDFNKAVDKELKTKNYNEQEEQELRSAGKVLAMRTRLAAVNDQLSVSEKFRYQLAIDGAEREAKIIQENYEAREKAAEEAKKAEEQQDKAFNKLQAIRSKEADDEQSVQKVINAELQALKVKEDLSKKNLENKKAEAEAAVKATQAVVKEKEGIIEANKEREKTARITAGQAKGALISAARGKNNINNATAITKAEQILSIDEVTKLNSIIQQTGTTIKEQLINGLIEGDTKSIDLRESLKAIASEARKFKITNLSELDEAKAKVHLLKDSFSGLIKPGSELSKTFSEIFKAKDVDTFNSQLNNLITQLRGMKVLSKDTEKILLSLGGNPDMVKKLVDALKEEKQASSDVSKAKKELAKATKDAEKATKEYAEVSKQEWQNGKEAAEITATRTRLENKAAESKRRVTDAETAYNTAMSNSAEKQKKAKEAAEAYQQSIDKLSITANNFEPQHLIKGSEVFASSVAGLGQTATAINSIMGMVNTWNNTDLTFGEKLVSSFSSLAFLLPSLTGIFTAYGKVMDYVNQTTRQETLATIAQLGAKNLQAGAELKASLIKKLVISGMDETIAKETTELLLTENLKAEIEGKTIAEAKAILMSKLKNQALTDGQKAKIIDISLTELQRKETDLFTISILKNIAARIKQLIQFATLHPIITGITTAITGLIAVLTFYSRREKEITENAQEFNDQQKEKLDKMRQEQEANKALVNSFEETLAIYQKAQETGENLEEAQNNLADAAKAVGEAYNIQGAALAKLTGNYDDFAEAVKKAELKEIEETLGQATTSQGATSAAILREAITGRGRRTLNSSYYANFGSAADFDKVKNIINEGNYKTLGISDEGNIELRTQYTVDSIVQAYEEIQDAYNRMAQEINPATLNGFKPFQNMQEMLGRLKDSYDQYQAQAEEIRNLEIRKIDLTGIIDGTEKISSSTIETVEDYNNYRDKLVTEIANTQGIDVADAENAKEIEKIQNAVEAYLGTISSITDIRIKAKGIEDFNAIAGANFDVVKEVNDRLANEFEQIQNPETQQYVPKERLKAYNEAGSLEPEEYKKKYFDEELELVLQINPRIDPKDWDKEIALLQSQQNEVEIQGHLSIVESAQEIIDNKKKGSSADWTEWRNSMSEENWADFVEQNNLGANGEDPFAEFLTMSQKQQQQMLDRYKVQQQQLQQEERVAQETELENAIKAYDGGHQAQNSTFYDRSSVLWNHFNPDDIFQGDITDNQYLEALQLELGKKKESLENTTDDKEKEKIQGEIDAYQTEIDAVSSLIAIQEERESKLAQMQNGDTAAKVLQPIDEFYERVERANLDIQEVKEYAEYLRTAIPNGAEMSDLALQELAARQKMLERGFNSLGKTSNDFYKLLDDGAERTEEYSKKLSEMQDSIMDIIGASDSAEFDGTIFDDKFFEDNREAIEKATQGDLEAIEALQTAAAKQVVLKMNVDDSTKEKVNGIIDDMQAAIPDDIEVGVDIHDPELNLDGYLDSLAQMMASGELTAERVNAILESIGFDPEIEWEEITMSAKDFQSKKTADGLQIDDRIIATNSYQASEVNGQVTVRIPKINGKSTSAPKSAGSSGGGGGGGKTKSKEKKEPTDERDRYHTITQKIQDAKDAYDELSKAEDRAFGKERIKAMEGITNNLKLQIDFQKQYLDEIRNYLEGDRAAVEALGATFDANGVITNYDDLIAELVAKYNEGVDAFNNGGLDEDAFKEQYEEPFNKAKEAIDQYVETINLLQSEELNFIDLQNDLADQFREIAAYKLGLHIDIDEDELKYLDFLLEMLGDNVEKAVDALTLLGQKFNTTKIELDHYVDGIKDLLALRGFSDSDIAAFLNGELTVQDLEDRGFTTDDIDKLREYRDAIQENTEALKELQEEIEAKFLDILDELNEKVEDAEDRFNHFTKMFEHFQNVVDIVGQDALGMTAETMKMLAQAAKENAIEMVKAAKTQLDSLIQVRAQAQAQLDAALEAQKNASTEEERIRAEEAAKYWSDMVDETQNRIDEAQESLADALENALESIKNEFSVALQQATKEFEASVTGNMKSLDLLATNFDRSNEVEDLYIPAYEKIYELTKLTRDINKSIDDTDSLWSKRELAKIQDEINQKMEDGVQLTEHDVEELRKRYELKLAEAALEEAQNSKNTVRMSRDNEGNWSYVYTADENDVAAAQQNYEDKLYEYQKMNADYIRELQENMIQVEQDMRDAINDLDVTSFASQEEYYAEVQRIIDAAQAKQQAYYDQMAQTLEQQGTLYNEDWQRYHDLTGYRMARDEEWVNQWDETTLAQLTGFETLDQYFNALNEAIGGPDDENSYVGQICEAYREMQESNERALNAAGTSMNTYSQDVTSAVNDINEEIEDTQNKVEEFSEKMTDMMKDVSSFIGEWKKEYGAAIEELTRFNDDLYKSCEKLITMLQKTYGVNAEFEGGSSVNDNGTEGGPSGSTRNGNGNPNTSGNSSGNNINENGSRGGWDPSQVDTSKWYYDADEHYRKLKDGVTEVPNTREKHTFQRQSNSQAVWEYCTKCGYVHTISTRSQYQNGNNNNGNNNHGGGGNPGIGADEIYLNMKSGGYTGTWISSAKTGMYTGSWAGPDLEENGRLAFLHQKELVLNANDTKNFLSAIDMVRQISDTIDLQAASRSGEFNFLLPGILNKEPDVLDQNVHIEAHFPNVTSHSEIEEAFTNLVGKASQFANR